ncbi:hypothetical protein O4106_21725 [Rhodococcus pyridinivorans]|uniref:hypothetical protein n=1 Tax=Rhodococcus pyridinivorans TaxID=103816 RepID=UPI0022B45799|nr:hypothetical protein [Rhodococcus pyridinivorans]MCZ4649445.1 hypothetical protein [Rhodococcus pyridinivorans]
MTTENDIRDAVHAWMYYQGYTEDDIEVGETDTHEASGCEWCPNHMAWDCVDGETGQSRHPMRDALEEAAELVVFLTDFGWHKADPAAETHTEWGVRRPEKYGSTVAWVGGRRPAESLAEAWGEGNVVVSRTVTSGPWTAVAP